MRQHTVDKKTRPALYGLGFLFDFMACTLKNYTSASRNEVDQVLRKPPHMHFKQDAENVCSDMNAVFLDTKNCLAELKTSYVK